MFFLSPRLLIYLFIFAFITFKNTAFLEKLYKTITYSCKYLRHREGYTMKRQGPLPPLLSFLSNALLLAVSYVHTQGDFSAHTSLSLVLVLFLNRRNTCSVCFFFLDQPLSFVNLPRSASLCFTFHSGVVLHGWMCHDLLTSP